MQPKNCFFLCAWLALTASAQISNVGSPFTTSTQAVISYQVADDAACTVEVREKGSSTLVPDFNPVLFPGSNSDLTRPSSVRVGQRRIVVAGRRVAEAASDGFRVSRALQADTVHDFTITCGASTHTGTFRTTNIPVGLAYMEPVPADPAKPGDTAWPAFRFADRNQEIVDPQTGLLLKRITREKDAEYLENRQIKSAFGNNWTSPSAVMVDDAQATTYSATTRDTLFLEQGYTEFFGGNRSAYSWPYNQLTLSLNAWCQGGDCSTASAADRTIEICLTLDGVSCHSDVLTQVLANCVSSCTGATPHRYSIGDVPRGPEGPLKAWYASGRPGWDHTSANKRVGTVNRDGVTVTRVGGNYFDNVWNAGSRIKINGTTYTIASVESEVSLTLDSAPAGVENGVPFETSNFGFLIRKATNSTTPIVIQHGIITFVGHNGPGYWDAAGGIETYTNCSNQLVQGPDGEMGWHCQVSGILIWIGENSGKVSYIGVPNIAPKAGVDGWPSTIYCAPFWDKNQGNDILCGTTDSSGDTILVRGRYFGNNNNIDTGPQGLYSTLKDCSNNPQPCWEFTNLTPKSQNRSLRDLATQFHPDFANFPNLGFKLIGPIGSSSRLLLTASRDSASNDNLSFMAIFNTQTGSIEAAGPSWKYWPVRWSVVHGAQDIGDPDWAFWALTYFRGGFTGRDSYAGYGPYYSRVASGPITATGEACPSRPPGSPIPANEWPTGNVCLTISVDGEPGDPTPKYSDNGTVTVVGDVVTVTGGDFPNVPTGSKMLIDGEYYVFTRTSSTTGTLAPQPVVSIVNSAYQLFHEEVDNPKTGTARRGHAYLQDAEVRDIFCGVNQPTSGGTNGCSFFFLTEYFRLLIKTGNTWVLERGVNNKGFREQFFALNANAYLITVPPACDMKIYPCAGSSVYWKFTVDPLSMNQNNGLILANEGQGAGHGILRPIGEVAAVTQLNCPVVDGMGYSCYNSRLGTSMEQTLLSADNLIFSGQPAFHGKMGHNVPNIVDSHPSMAGLVHPMFQNPGTVPRWFVDGRPFLGGAGVSGSSGSPASSVDGTLYKFTAAQVPRLRRKILPTFAACGSNPLVDISGPNSLIGGSSTDHYRYCVAAKNGECRGDSQAGDVYFNCPFLSTKYCRTGLIGAQESEVRDVCIGDHASMTMSTLQGGFEKRSMGGMHIRPLSKGLNQHHYVDVFWNVKTTPDGKWMLMRSMWADDYAHQAVLAKLPPFPKHDGINRADFIPVEVTIPAPADPAETHAVVEFGYGNDLFCTSRSEKCVKGAGSDEFSFEYENPAGVACASGCKITVPGLPQHVLYYRVVRQKAGGIRSSEGEMQVTALP